MFHYGIILYLTLLHRLVICSNVTETIISPQDQLLVEEPIINENIWENLTKDEFVHAKEYESRLSSNDTIVLNDKNAENKIWNIDRFFEIWNPIAISRIWKNETYLDAGISLSCGKDLTRYMMAVSQKTNWALKMIDADGKYTWGVFSNNKYWIGDLNQCRRMENEFIEWQKNKEFQRNEELPPFRVSVNAVNFNFKILKPGLNETYNVTLGLCMPIMCETKDVERLLYFVQDQFNTNLPINITINHIKNLSKEKYILWEDTTFYILLISFFVVCALIFMGTFYDVVLRYKFLLETYKKNNNITSMSGEKSLSSDGDLDCRITITKLLAVTEHNGSLDVRNSKVVPKPLLEALLSFSLLVNMSKICSLNVSEDTLAPIHGLRFYSTLWILLVHMCMATDKVSDNKMFRSKAETNFFYQTIANGTYSVDTFFFMSGCLVAFLYYRTMANKTLREKSIVKGCIGRVLQFLGMMFYRYFRLTPIYLLIIGLAQVSSKWNYNNTIIGTLGAVDREACRDLWWQNILYINVYYNSDKRCMIWSWYLSNDTQFYTIGIIILIIGVSFLPAAAFIGAFFLITSWITTAIITLNTNHIVSIEDPFANSESVLDKPWIRIGPYLIGMATGWYLFKTGCKANMNKIVVAIGWSVSSITMFSIIYGVQGIMFGSTLSAIYTALSHSGWAISLAWILIACVSGYGGIANHILSWKYLYPISRLTYCNYLVHGIILRSMILQNESSLHLTYGFMAYLFFGLVVLSYAASLFLSLFFEAPVVSLLRIIHPLRNWKSR